MAKLIGTTIKHYQITQFIKDGGFGEVYLARQSNVEREVVVKRIKPEYSNQADFIRRFEQEANLIARLEHYHIVPLYDYWRDGNGAYLIMRYMRGGSLKDLLEQSSPSLESCALIIDQISMALSFAHQHRVIHRDIKPDNILMDEDGNAFLADFGIAKDLQKPGDSGTSNDAVIGTLDYLSPEQARGEPVSPRSDIYSLAVVVYEILEGKHPFQEFSSVERLYKHINDPMPRIENLTDPIRDDVNHVIQKATEKDPANRYASVLEFATELRNSLALEQITLPAESQLTKREHEVLQCLVDGLTNHEIADKLYIATGTVKDYNYKLFKKLGVKNRVQAATLAIEMNLLGQQIAPVHAQLQLPLSTASEPINPYKGLMAFEEADRANFFGRDDLVQKLLLRMQQQHHFNRFLSVVGPSGSGKSSIVKAGLIPAIRDAGLPGSENWFITDMLPGNHPLDALEVALTRLSTDVKIDISEQLKRDHRGLIRIADMILPRANSELLIVVDQFEEVFTHVDDESERQQFLDLLRTAISEDRSSVRVIVTLRADYYDRPLRYPEFGELMRSRMETVLPLTAQGLERAIRGPAETARVTFEQGLVEQIISSTQYQAGALPLLQYALTELFEAREGRLLTHKAYQEIGGAVGALAKHADEIYLEAGEEAQTLIRQIFLRLVTPGEGAEDTRRRVNLTELLALTDNSDLMQEIIDAFVEDRLLSVDNDAETRQATVEVAHEAIIREWDTLRGWLSESRDDLRMHRSLIHDADEWQSSGFDSAYLASSTKLEILSNWSKTTNLILTDEERAYFDESLKASEEKYQQDKARKAREEEIARRADNFQRASAILTGVSIIALVVTAFAALIIVQANKSASESSILREAAQAFSDSLLLAFRALDTAETIDPVLGLTMALEASEIDSPPQTRRILSQLAYAPGARRRIEGHYGDVVSVAFSPDGQQILSSDSRTIILRDLSSGEVLRSFDEHTSDVVSMTFSPDGQQILSGDSRGHLILRDTNSGEVVWQFRGHSSTVFSLAFSPDGQRILSSSNDRTLVLRDASSGDALLEFEGFHSPINTVAFSPDGQQIVSGASNGELFLWDVDSGDLLWRLRQHSSAILSVAFSPDGLTIVSGSRDSTLILWDASSGAVLRRFEEHSLDVNSVAFSSDGQQIVSGSRDDTLIVWDALSGDLLYRFGGHTDDVNSVAFSPDGRQIVSGSSDDTLILWDIRPGDLLHRLEGHTADISSLAFSPDGQEIASGASNGEFFLWDTGSGNLLRPFEEHTHGVLSTAFSPDGQTMLSGSPDQIILWDADLEEFRSFYQGYTGYPNSPRFSPDGQQILSGSSPVFAVIRSNVSIPSAIILWDASSGKVLRRFEGHSQPVWTVAFSPDGQQIVSGAGHDSFVVSGERRGELFLWDTRSGELLRRFEGHNARVWSVAFSPDGQQIVSGSTDYTVILWDASSGELLRRFEAHPFDVWSVTFSPDGQHILSGSEDGTVILWDVNSGELLQRFEENSNITNVAFSPDGQYILHSLGSGELIMRDVSSGDIVWHADSVSSATFSPDGQQILSSSFDGTLILWDVSSGNLLQRFDGDRVEIYNVSFSPDGQQILFGSDGQFFLWRIGDDDFTPFYEGHFEEVVSMTFSPDRQQILSGSEDNTLILRDVSSGELLHRFVGHSSDVVSVAFSFDGQQILSGSEDNTVILWDVSSGEPLHRFEGHSGTVNTVAFSPDGQQILSGSIDNTVILWDARSGAVLQRIQEHSGSINSVAFSPDGRQMISGSADNTVILWDVNSGELLRRFEGHNGAVMRVAFSSDGQYIISGSADDTLILWRNDSIEQLQEWVRENRLLVELSCEQRLNYGLECQSSD